MIFQHTIDKVLDGTKTQTRRIVKPGQYEGAYGNHPYNHVFHPPRIDKKGFSVYATAYEIGKTYAVQPGRGKPAVARIRVTGIRREDVRTISDDDVRAEGFSSRFDFWSTWVEMHDKSFLSKFHYAHECDYLREYGFFTRPDAKYDAWVIEFELVREVQS